MARWQHWAVRGSTDYVLTQHNIFGGPAYTQNISEFRLGSFIPSEARAKPAPAAPIIKSPRCHNARVVAKRLCWALWVAVTAPA